MSATRATDDDTAKWTSATAAEAMMAQMLLAQCDTPPYNALTAQLDVLSIAVSRYKILKFIVLIFEISQCFTRDDSTKKIILELLLLLLIILEMRLLERSHSVTHAGHHVYRIKVEL